MTMAEDVVMFKQRLSDAAAVALAGILTIVFLLIASLPKCKGQTNFSASMSTLTDKTTNTTEKANVGLFVEFSADTVTIRGRGVIFQETGVWWHGVDSCRGVSPGYRFSWWPGRLDIISSKVYWILEK